MARMWFNYGFVHKNCLPENGAKFVKENDCLDCLALLLDCDGSGAAAASWRTLSWSTRKSVPAAPITLDTQNRGRHTDCKQVLYYILSEVNVTIMFQLSCMLSWWWSHSYCSAAPRPPPSHCQATAGDTAQTCPTINSVSTTTAASQP